VGFYFSKCPANSKPPALSSDDRESPCLNIMDLPGIEHAECTLRYSISFNNQTDQKGETEVTEEEGL
jgi:hypothetical protein